MSGVSRNNVPQVKVIVKNWRGERASDMEKNRRLTLGIHIGNLVLPAI